MRGQGVQRVKFRAGREAAPDMTHSRRRRSGGLADVVAWSGSCAATVLCLYVIWMGPGAPRPVITASHTRPAVVTHAAVRHHRGARHHR